MSDICKCTGNCPVSEYCYRYMAIPNPYGQTFSYLESECIPYDYDLLMIYDKTIKEEENERYINYDLYDLLLEEIYEIMDFD